MAWHCLEPADASVFDSATHLFRFPIKLPVPPARVWESLASDRSLAAWPLGRGLYLDLHWTSPRPFGTGTTRQVTLPCACAPCARASSGGTRARATASTPRR